MVDYKEGQHGRGDGLLGPRLTDTFAPYPNDGSQESTKLSGKAMILFVIRNTKRK